MTTPDADPAETETVVADTDRKRIEEQLAQLEKKKLELSRALLLADHPELGAPLRTVESGLYALARIEARMKEGLSKGEARRVETLGKKREQLLTKKAELDARRAELDGQLDEVQRELATLGEDRVAAFEVERTEALRSIVVALAQHAGVFTAANVDPSTLVPELDARQAELKRAATELAASE